MWFFQRSMCFSLTWGLYTFRKVGAKNAAVEVRMNLGWFSSKLTCGKRKDHGHVHAWIGAFFIALTKLKPTDHLQLSGNEAC